MKTLNTGISIKYNKNGNIKECISIFDKQITSKPLTMSKVTSSYIPLIVKDINEWFQTFNKQ